MKLVGECIYEGHSGRKRVAGSRTARLSHPPLVPKIHTKSTAERNRFHIGASDKEGPPTHPLTPLAQAQSLLTNWALDYLDVSSADTLGTLGKKGRLSFGQLRSNSTGGQPQNTDRMHKSNSQSPDNLHHPLLRSFALQGRRCSRHRPNRSRRGNAATHTDSIGNFE